MKKISGILSDIKLWMFNIKLKLIEDKTKWFIKRSSLITVNIHNKCSVLYISKDIYPPIKVKDLGVIFYTELSFHNHFNRIAHSANFY